MGWLRSVVSRPLKLFGVDLVSSWQASDYAHTLVHAELLRALFLQQAVDCVFDVGAFNGHFGKFLREHVGYRGTLLSFEPQPEPFRALAEASATDPNWHVFNIALGACKGQAEMNVMSKPWFSSFLAPSPETPKNMADRNVVQSTVHVAIETVGDLFDSLAKQHGFRKPFLKMDTQGFDLEVFRGAQPRIDRFVGLQSEVSMVPIYAGMPDWKTAIETYERAGFALSGFFPVSADEGLRAVEMDAVLVRHG